MFYIVAITDVLSRIIKFTFTGFSTESHYYWQITGKIMVSSKGRWNKTT